jgi:hypothetical protein
METVVGFEARPFVDRIRPWAYNIRNDDLRSSIRPVTEQYTPCLIWGASSCFTNHGLKD